MPGATGRELTITVYGGAAGDGEAGEVGGNRILVETPDRAWFCDFGMRFKLAGHFYEEFLKPRGSSLGLRDFLRMGLLPPLEGIYRGDLWAHEPDLWDRYRDHPHHRRIERLDGVLVSHGHLDHTGNIGFLRSDIPVYTGLVTATTGKAMEDTKGIGPENETCYIAPREVDGNLLKAASRRASNDRISSAKTRTSNAWTSSGAICPVHALRCSPPRSSLGTTSQTYVSGE